MGTEARNPSYHIMGGTSAPPPGIPRLAFSRTPASCTYFGCMPSLPQSQITSSTCYSKPFTLSFIGTYTPKPSPAPHVPLETPPSVQPGRCSRPSPCWRLEGAVSHTPLSPAIPSWDPQPCPSGDDLSFHCTQPHLELAQVPLQPPSSPTQVCVHIPPPPRAGWAASAGSLHPLAGEPPAGGE